MNPVEKTQINVASQRQADTDKKLKKAAADFEALYTFNLLKTMRRTIPSGGLIPRSQARETYEMMLDQQIAEAVSRKGRGMGLKQAVYNELTRNYRKKDSSSTGQASINIKE